MSYLSAKEVSKALNISMSSAYRMLVKAKSKPYQKVTVMKFCEVHQLNCAQFLSVLAKR